MSVKIERCPVCTGVVHAVRILFQGRVAESKKGGRQERKVCSCEEGAVWVGVITHDKLKSKTVPRCLLF